MSDNKLADTLRELTATLEVCLMSPNIPDSNLEPSNIVDVLSNSVGYYTKQIARALTPLDAADGTDAQGGNISSLTEAVMGITSALTAVAGSLSDIASAIDRHNS